MIANDYELIYLVQVEMDPIAYQRIVDKYRKFIYKIIHSLQIDYGEIEDFYQEGLMILDKAIYLFSEKYDKTFTKYFELLLRRRLIYLKKQMPQYFLMEDPVLIEDLAPPYWDLSWFEINFDSELEKMVHELYFVEKMSISQICEIKGLKKKQVYNAIHRIKEKYKAVV